MKKYYGTLDISVSLPFVAAAENDEEVEGFVSELDVIDILKGYRLDTNCVIKASIDGADWEEV